MLYNLFDPFRSLLVLLFEKESQFFHPKRHNVVGAEKASEPTRRCLRSVGEINGQEVGILFQMVRLGLSQTYIVIIYCQLLLVMENTLRRSDSGPC